MSFVKKEDLLYVAFFYFSVLTALVDKYFVIDRHKGKYGACVGLFALACMSGWEVLYPLCNIIVNTAIIYFCGKRSGVLSFIFSCGYLFYFRYFCSASSLTNMFMMSSSMKMMSASMDLSVEGKHSCYSPREVIFYALHYVGLIGVPFYTFKTYCDYIRLPFKHQPSGWQYKAMVCMIDSTIIMLARLFLSYLHPLKCVLDDEFDNSNIIYKIYYIYPYGFDFTLRIANAFALGDISCCITGFGAYPQFTKPKCGHGPTQNMEKMYAIKPEHLSQHELSYETINNVDLIKVHFNSHFKDILKYWNRTIQFWLYKYIYTVVPYNFLKKPATMLFSSYWHGISFCYISSIFLSSLALFVEDRWGHILGDEKPSPLEKTIRIILKLHLIYNFLISFVCQDWNFNIHYQKSVYWNYLVILLSLLASSFLLKKTRKL